MSNARTVCAILLGLLVVVSACTDLFIMTTKEPGAGKLCQGPSIMQNVIGTWRCGQRHTIIGDTLSRSAPFTSATFNRFGTLVFDTNAYVVDPDSLLENHLYGGQVVKYKKFSFETNSISYPEYGDIFWIWQYAKNSQGSILKSQGYYFKVLANECNRIHLRGDTFEMVLIRQ